MNTHDVELLKIGRSFPALTEVLSREAGQVAFICAVNAVLASRPAADESAKRVDMVLLCPRCGVQHIDGEEWSDDPHDIEQGQMRVWSNPPHRSHLCHHCKFIWRPADVPTNGVANIKTKGRDDSAPTTVANKEAVTLSDAWKFEVSESDDRMWLTLSPKEGAFSATLSCAATIDEGRSSTIAAHVLREFKSYLAQRDASKAEPTS